MGEPLTSQLVASLLGELHVAFPRNLGAQNPAMMADIYRNGLAGLSGDGVRWAVKQVIQEDKFFPKVSRLRELAQTWQRRNVIAVTVRNGDGRPEDVCMICGARYEGVAIERVVIDKRGFAVKDGEGKVVLETVTVDRILHDRARHGIQNGTHHDS